MTQRRDRHGRPSAAVPAARSAPADLLVRDSATAPGDASASARSPRSPCRTTRATRARAARDRPRACRRRAAGTSRRDDCSSAPSAVPAPASSGSSASRRGYSAGCSLRMTTSARSPLTRQYSCASSTCRTSGSASASVTRTSDDRQVAGNPVGPQAGCPSVFCARSAGLMHDASAPNSRDASRSNRIAWSSVEPEMLQRDVHVREGHRERARRRAAVAILARQRERAPSRSAATPVANVTRTTAPGASRTRSRSAAIGSSTAPVVPDSARPSSAAGLAGERPRPMNRARSVSHSTAPPRRPSTPST